MAVYKMEHLHELSDLNNSYHSDRKKVRSKRQEKMKRKHNDSFVYDEKEMKEIVSRNRDLQVSITKKGKSIKASKETNIDKSDSQPPIKKSKKNQESDLSADETVICKY